MIKTTWQIKKIIHQLEEMLMDEERKVESKISHTGSQHYYDEMKGCARGMSMARSSTVRFLKEKLL